MNESLRKGKSIPLLSYATRQSIVRALFYLLLLTGMCVMVFPFYWMISSSFKTSGEMNLFPPTLAPRNWFNFNNYETAFRTAPFARYFLNSVVVTAGSVVTTALTTILGAFAFSRLRFPGREVIFSLLLSMMMVPFEMLVITNYQTIVKVALNDTLIALVIPFTSSIFYMYILRNFFQTIPDGLYWSARVDGWKKLRRMYM